MRDFGDDAVEGGGVNGEDKLRPVPFCCSVCVHLYPGDDWRDRDVWECELSVWLPTRKQSCKKQRRIGEIR